VDRLVQVWLKDGSEQWVLVHVEIQSQQDALLPKRLFEYYFRAFDLFDGRSLTCLAILGDEVADWKPQSFSAGWWGTRVVFEFRVNKLLEYADRQAELEQIRNPFARFVLAHLKTVATQGDYESRLEWKVRIIQGLYDMGVSEAEIGQLYHDFDWLLALPEPLAVRYHKTMVKFEEEREMPHVTTAERIGRKIGRDEGEVIGREAGIEIGKAVAARNALLTLLTARFGELPSGVSQAIEAATTERLESWFSIAVTAVSLDAVGIKAQH
jgi:tetrahydromethanopterin S-methyltransferase subunit G